MNIPLRNSRIPPSPNAAERADDERQLWDRHGIQSRGPSYPYPNAYRHTLQTIADFRNQRFSKYHNLLEIAGGPSPWKKEIVKRTRELVEVASRLLSRRATEMKWRLDTEPRVFSQLDKNIDWFICISSLDTRGSC